MKKTTDEVYSKISKFIDKNSDKIIDFTLECVRTSSETPPGDETEICKLITKKASEWGLDKPEIFKKKNNRPNLLFNIKGLKKGKKLLLSGHLDTKPIGDTTEWKVLNPEKPAIIDGKLYGRGSTDMKGGVVGMLAAAGALKECKIKLEGDLGLLFTADEEGGCAYGAKYISEKGIKADSIILGEPSGEEKNFDAIGLASRGVLLGKIILHGTQMHSSISDRGGCVNASVKMARVLVEFADNLKKYLHFKPHKLYPFGPTINPGVTLEGGVFYGVIPGQAGFGFDLRVIPGMGFDVLKADIKRFLKDLKKKDKDIDAELVLEKPPLDAWIPPAEIDENHPVVEDCISSAEKVLGYKPRKVGEPFGTEASFYVNELGISTVPSFGPGYIRLAHGPDEYVETRAIIDAAKIYALTALKFLKIQ